MPIFNSVKIFLFIIYVINTQIIMSQNSILDRANIEKYWYYRDRLKYFIIPGELKGESIVAGFRNSRYLDPPTNLKSIGYGQQVTYFGYYLGVLATEYYLLNYYGEDTQETLKELEYALNAYIYQLDRCEYQFYNIPDKLDGFFRIEPLDCTTDFLDLDTDIGREHLLKLNTNLTPSDTWDKYKDGRPGWIDQVESCSDGYKRVQSMSQDEVIGLMKGLALVYKCVPQFANLARSLAYLTISYTRNTVNGDWIIREPDGTQVASGGDARVYSYPFSYVACKYFGFPWEIFSISSDILIMSKAIWWLAKYINIGGSVNSSMTMNLAAVCDCWHEPGGTTNTDYGIYNISKNNNWDAFYLMIWQLLHNKKSQYFDENIAFIQLATAPCEGPFCYSKADGIKADHGWASAYKFEQKFDYQYYGKQGFEAVYNGLDYLLLYNLYHITKLNNGYDMPYYRNMVKVKMNWDFPIADYVYDQWWWEIGTVNKPAVINAFKSIVSNSVIDVKTHDINGGDVWVYNIPAEVTFRAGEEIILTSGFKVKEGASFHALVKPFICENNMLKSDSVYSYYGADFYTTYDSIAVYLHNFPGEWSPDPVIEYNFESDIEETPTVSKNESVAIFPNPFDNYLIINIIGFESETIKIQLFDVKGNVVLEFNNLYCDQKYNMLKINTENLPSGLYCLILSSLSKVESVKVIKN